MREKCNRKRPHFILSLIAGIHIAALSIFLVFMIFSCSRTDHYDYRIASKWRLWYDKPAYEWTQALPVGNGRIGAMVFGGLQKEVIQFNEESLWAGQKMDYNNRGALGNLDTIRELLFKDKNREAYALADKHLLSIPPRLRSYQTFGDVIIISELDTGKVKNYSRELDLNNGIVKVQYAENGNMFQREIFASAADNLIVMHFSAKDSAMLNFRISLQREADARIYVTDENQLVLEGQIIDKPSPLQGPGGKHMRFASVLEILNNDGDSRSENSFLIIENARNVTLVLAAHTDYNRGILNFDPSIEPLNLCFDQINNISSTQYNTLKERHVNLHKPMFERMDIAIGDEKLDSIPTDIRLERMKEGGTDDDLIALYFQFGRYLLMGSSGFFAQLPANLQGIWNHHLEAPWNSDFHTNINLQMNYWPAEVCNLSETFEPYIDFFTEIKKPGQTTASAMYGARGWTMHHVTDAFGYTAVNAAIKWGMFPMGAAWVCFPVWRHFEFTRDTLYLREKAWPLMKGATRFVLDFLVESPEGYLVTSPSYSPENSFILPGTGEEMRLTYGPTMDIMIISELFDYALQATEVLGIDEDIATEIRNTLPKLPPFQIGADGTIQEWINDYEEFEPGHRHISHLLGLHPGKQITEKTPELFHAAKKTIEKRLKYGGAGTGWSRAWTINFYARLKDGNEAYNHLTSLLQLSTLPNLFDTHPPFQIDGNFGGTAGIAEMLLQSHGEYIELLPALPDAWPKGKISGLKARGNFEIDMTWKDGIPTEVVVKSNNGSLLKLKHGTVIREVSTSIGEIYIFRGAELEIQ